MYSINFYLNDSESKTFNKYSPTDIYIGVLEGKIKICHVLYKLVLAPCK